MAYNSTEFVTKVRLLIEETSITKAYSPELPKTGTSVAAVSLMDGETTNKLNATRIYSTVRFRVLIRGTKNDDTTTRGLVDEVVNKLNMQNGLTLTSSNIEMIYVDNEPQYVGKDENERILYNVNFKAIIE